MWTDAGQPQAWALASVGSVPSGTNPDK
jgi:hypothetical protein